MIKYSEHEPANDPTHLVLNQSIEPAIEILLRGSQRIRTFALLDNYVYLHESDFNFGQVSDNNSFDEAI